MKLPSALLVLIMAMLWLIMAAPVIGVSLRVRREHWGRRVAVGLGGVLMLLGSAGILAMANAAWGGFDWLPATFEWPVGSVDGVILTKNDRYVVPHTPSGRIQVYDDDWRFLRGWPVDAEAGAFKLGALDDNRFEVFTARGDHHYVFNTEGELIAKGTYPGNDYDSLGDAGRAVVVPTAPWLRVFSSPSRAWGVGVAGMMLLVLFGKLSKRHDGPEKDKT